jgi:hypothetical protein
MAISRAAFTGNAFILLGTRYTPEAGGESILLWSADGDTWLEQKLPFLQGVGALASSSDTVVLGGAQGIILSTENSFRFPLWLIPENGKRGFSYESLQSSTIESSSDLKNWTALTNLLSFTPGELKFENSTNSQQFYRIRHDR